VISYFYNKLTILTGGENISGGDTGTVNIEVAGVANPHRYAESMREWHRSEASAKTLANKKVID